MGLRLNKHLVTRMSSGLWGKGSAVGDGKEARPRKARPQNSEWRMDSFIHSTVSLQKLKPRELSFPSEEAV